MREHAGSGVRLRTELRELRERVADLERLAGDRLHSHQQLEKPAEGSRDLFHHTPSAYALHEVATDERGQVVDYTFLEVNQAFEDLTGLKAESVLGQRASSLFPQVESEAILGIYGRVARTGEPVRVEHYSALLDRHLEVSAFSPRYGQFATILCDVTARKNAEEALRLRTACFDQLFESSPLGIVLLSNDDRIVECNRGFERLFGYSRGEVRGRRIGSLIVRPEHSSDATHLSEKALRGEVVDAEGVRYRSDGTPVDVRILAHPIRLGDEQIGIYGIYNDISRRKRDQLTQLVNRVTFMERLELELERAARNGTLTAVLALDLNQLKDVNDTYGLTVGDALLQSVAQRLRATLRAGASIARLGGDEFGILQVDLSDVGNAAGLARRLLTVLGEPFEIDRHRIHVGARIGIAVAPAAGSIGPKQLLGQAERALAQAKREGHVRFQFHAAHMDREVRARMLLGQELHGALDRSELFLEYQPQVSLPDRQIVGLEALIRWRHPRDEVIGPNRFIPVAEASGVIMPIGEWVLRSACAQAAHWRRGHGVGIPVAVNLSPVQFKDPTFADSVARALEDSGLAPELLELELTERILVEATESVREALQRLQELGVRLTLDDFGKGYSSLEYLRRLPLQKLKIDRSFVQNLDADASDVAIVSAITALGSRLGLKVLAEGVERRSQLDLLAAEGCHEIQGSYFSPPVSVTALDRLLRLGNDSIRPVSTGN